ncbi:uncharacterized protein LOC130452537 [Diorhabda sublineata]|uniref:uncharacterized protein LOC130452537 n=1 Tax=Diorhabda sublineata TaxID=1163346 RepID=UPI0024E073D8|nr:uncharacterized protein LOC130452537 [Diorhabda sublineata]
MVILNMGLPDPDHPNEELIATNQNVFVVTDEDSDQEMSISDSIQTYTQYQPLSTFSNEDIDTVSDDDTDSDNNENSEITASSTMPAPSIDSMESILVKEVWSESSTKVCDIEMDNKKVDEVKQLMLNITLPPSAIPDWAAKIPEEDWKSHLMSRLEKTKNNL